jgi:hypothetical protein
MLQAVVFAYASVGDHELWSESATVMVALNSFRLERDHRNRSTCRAIISG